MSRRFGSKPPNTALAGDDLADRGQRMATHPVPIEQSLPGHPGQTVQASLGD
jgi:hypothetical protein